MRFFIGFCIFIVLTSLSYSQVIYRGSDYSKVAFTFDDGPSEKYTRQVLKILKDNNIKAMFFVTGKNSLKNSDILKEISDQGHEIGNHTYNHSRITWLNDEKLIDEIKRTSEIVETITGKQTVYFRPPFGSVSKEKLGLLSKNGYITVMWYGNADDFYHLGWGMRTPQSITNRIVSQLYGGNIILMHDNSKQLVEALPMIIKEIRSRGYKIVPFKEVAASSN